MLRMLSAPLRSAVPGGPTASLLAGHCLDLGRSPVSCMGLSGPGCSGPAPCCLAVHSDRTVEAVGGTLSASSVQWRIRPIADWEVLSNTIVMKPVRGHSGGRLSS
eukprot:4249352-Prymnesium_polylepis.1